MKSAPKSLSIGLIVSVAIFLTNAPVHGDTIYVSSSGNNEIIKYDSNGNGSVFASGLNVPTGVAFDGNGNLYVANFDGNLSTFGGHIVKLDSAGNAFPFANTNVNQPYGLAVDGSGNVYVANRGNKSIEKFDSQGQGSVFGNLVLINPTGLAFDSSGNLYVADAGNNRIVKYDSNGNGSVFASNLGVVKGLAFDRSDNLYVANDNNEIWKVDSNGKSLFANSGLNIPYGMAFDSSGNLYVANPVNSSGSGPGWIEKYDSSGHGSVFATGGLLQVPAFIAIQVPEPATWSLLALGAVAVLGNRRRHQRAA